MQAPPYDSLIESLRWLQTSQEYSDLKIFCGDEVFQVHKAVVCPRSKFFTASCKWGRDGQSKDEIELPDDDPMLVGLMIDYLYQIDYDDLLANKVVEAVVEDELTEPVSPVATAVFSSENLDDDREESSESRTLVAPALQTSEPVEIDVWGFSRYKNGEKKKKDKKKKKRSKSHPPRLPNHGEDLDKARLTINTQMYAMADKYEIVDLKALAKTKFEAAVEHDWESRVFAHAAELVFSTTHETDQGLRSIVIRTINQHRELVDYEEIQTLLNSGNGMAWALVQVLLADQDQIMT